MRGGERQNAVRFSAGTNRSSPGTGLPDLCLVTGREILKAVAVFKWDALAEVLRW